MRCRMLGRWVVCLLLLGAATAVAQTPETQPAAPATATPELGSPQAAVRGFYERLRAHDFTGAAGYLDLSGSRPGEGPKLAEHLGEVLDARGWVDLSAVSARPEGEERDGLAPGEDQVGVVRGERDRPDPLLMVRQDRTAGTRWVFSRSTVSKIPAWHALVQPGWLETHLPEPLLRHGPRDLTWWQWIALPLLFFAALILGRLLATPARWLLARLVSRTQAKWDDQLVEELRGPIALVLAIALMSAAARFLLLSPLGLTFVHQLLRAALLVAFFWAALRGLMLFAEVTRKASWANVGVQSAVPLLLKIARVFVVAIALVMVVSELGYPVASLIAGLGIGGLAVALAAQKTVENVFGSVSIGVDQPFRVGDFVKVEDVVTGTVENLGLRSTRIRTLDRTLISIPNGKLAEMRVETFAARDRIRFFTLLGLEYRSTADQLRTIVSGIDALLAAHPKMFDEGRSVRLVGFGESSINVEVSCWLTTADFNEFTQLRQELLLEIMAIVERAGTGFAFPTRTIQFAGGAPVALAGPERPRE